MSRWSYRVLIALLLLAGFGAAAIVLSLRYYVLPNIDQHRDRIASLITDAVGQRVTIGQIDADWDGLRPHLSLRDVVVHDAAGRPALELQRVETTLSWRSMAAGEARTRLLEIIGPSLTIRRGADGQLSVAGLTVSAGSEGGGFARWILEQRGIVIRDAAVVWIDESRGAPELWLKQVNLRLESRGRRHRIGITAVPPEGLAAPFDVRAEWRGNDPVRPSGWEGRIFADLRDTSLSGWEAWVDLPGGIEQGTGAVRIWAELRAGRLVSLVSDVELASVRARLARDLADLELDALSGRLSWRQLTDGFELTATGLALAQPGRTPALPTIARLRWQDGSPASASGVLPSVPAGRLVRGELTADTLDLEPWAALAEQVPLDPATRNLLAQLSPRGRLTDVAIAWSGPFDALDSWQVRGRFDDIEVRAAGAWPGVAGLSGTVDGNERGGTLSVDAERFGLTLPAVFARPLAFDAVSGKGSWNGRGRTLALRIASLTFSNADLAGTLSGEYRPGESAHGFADLTGSLSRAEARAVARYMPLRISEKTRNWVATSLVAGRSRDVRFRLKGDLDDYPFGDPGRNRGQFLVAVKVEDGVLDYAPGWPRITDLDGDVVFRGRRLEILPRNATIAGVKLQRVRAVVPDVVIEEELLEVTGEAESASADFLRFITQSPVDDMLDGATREMEAQGRGRLALKFVLPLRHPQDTTLAGSYQFVNNRLVIDRDAPVLDAVNGRLDFTDSGIRVNGATLQMLGGPATINVASQRDGSVRIGVAGRITADSVRRELPVPLGQALRGATDWRATLNYRRKLGDLLVESSLVGLAIDLPPPFDKAAADTLPLRFEQVSGPQRDRLSIALGSVASAQVLRRIDGGQPTVERATVAFGGAPAPVPERPGISISGTLKQVSVDAWRPLLASLKPASGNAGSGENASSAGAAGGGRSGLGPGDIDLRIGLAELAGRRFNDVVVRTSAQAGGWQGSLASREASGELAWRSSGRGRLIARMKQVNLPPAQPVAGTPQPVKSDDGDLPALDITIDDLLVSGKALGRFELLAQPEARDWRIERLRVSNPDASFQMDGLWQSWLVSPRTQVNVRLDIVDGGRLLARLGYPDGLRGGAGRIEGPLSWAGSPQDLDIATLGGSLTVEVTKGQFLQLEPGVGRLLGVFNLQNLPRRVSLDFRDVFSEGFAFDEISGAMKVARGIGRIENFRIQGGSARVLMSGELNLARETQNLQVRVTPSIGDGLALAGALLGGPVAGIATFLVQRALKDPLAQLATFDYAVTGTWAEPTVSRLPRAEPAPAGAPG